MKSLEIENPMMKETYIKLLRDTLERKLQVLDQLILLTEQQDKVISAEHFDEDSFMQCIEKKEEFLGDLDKLDQGFERVYQAVSTELSTKKELFKGDIFILQELITKITDRSVSLQAMEKRNKSKLELLFSRKRKEIKSSKALGKSATNYYKTMVQQHEQKSIFYDKKQ